MKNTILQTLLFTLSLILLIAAFSSCGETNAEKTGSDIRDEIINVYYEMQKKKGIDLNKEDIHLELITEYDSMQVIRISSSPFFDCVLSSETVGGITFDYNYGPVESYGLKVYNGRRIYSLDEAFDSGVVNSDDLSQILSAYNMYVGKNLKG